MIGWLQCAAGVSGDMLLGALVDAGVPLDVIDAAVQKVAPERIALSATSLTKAGIAATQVHVETVDSHSHRTWASIRAKLSRVEFPGRNYALNAFERLAHAEAAVHGTSPDEVHFHEVGALDAIADVVGVSAGFAYLNLDELVVSPIALGGGLVRAAHGDLAVPGPAVVELLHGVPTYGGPVPFELATPTGAALAVTFATSWGTQPRMRTTRQGFGAGTRDLVDRANVVRLVLGEAFDLDCDRAPDISDRVVLEANVDDLDGRLWPHTLTALLEAGADDAWLVPIVMKKGRAAHTVRVLVSPHRAAAVRTVIFSQTSAIGLRETNVTKHALKRSVTEVLVEGKPVRVKLAHDGGSLVNAQPEWADVAAVADQLGKPPKLVLALANAAYWASEAAGAPSSPIAE